MHQALCIDEIIRSIFGICADGGQSALLQLASCCKAWKDPALDNLWRHLPCAAPLLRLIPGVIEKNGVFSLGCPINPGELTSFHSYALRVKSIAHRHRRPLDPIILSLLQVAAASGNTHLLPNITTVHIGPSGWNGLIMRMGISCQLRHLTLDVGFSTNDRGRSNVAAAEEYLEQVVRITSPHHLSLRGSALGSERISCALSSMRSLRVLSLTAGKSLTVHTLAAIATFPFLGELDIHAGHIDADELDDAMAVHSIPLFPALHTLHVRAHPSLVELLLQLMSSSDLRYLNIEAEQPTQAPSSWRPALSLIPVKASNTLLELRIEHHVNIDIDIDSNSNNTPAHSDSSVSNSAFTLTTIRPLAQLPHLQQFTLDTIVPPDLCDSDIEEMVKWWPHLEHLDLGGLLSDVDCLGQAWKLQTSINCLETLARGCPKLETLIINLDITSSDISNVGPAQATPLPQHPLRCLTVGSIAAPNPLHWSQYLCRVFPSLIEVDGIAPHEEIWSTVQALLRIPQLSSENLEQMNIGRVYVNPQDGKEFYRAFRNISFVH